MRVEHRPGPGGRGRKADRPVAGGNPRTTPLAWSWFDLNAAASLAWPPLNPGIAVEHAQALLSITPSGSVSDPRLPVPGRQDRYPGHIGNRLPAPATEMTTSAT